MTVDRSPSGAVIRGIRQLDAALRDAGLTGLEAIVLPGLDRERLATMIANSRSGMVFHAGVNKDACICGVGIWQSPAPDCRGITAERALAQIEDALRY